MIISSSDVSMSSNRNFASISYEQSESLTVRAGSDDAARITISPESINLLEQLKEAKDDIEEKAKKAAENNMKNSLKAMIEEQARRAKEAKNKKPYDLENEKDWKIKTLKKIIEMLTSIQDKRLGRKSKKAKPEMLDKRSNSDISNTSWQGNGQVAGFSKGQNASQVVNGSASTGTGGTTWIKHVVKSSFVAEVENTAFSTNGVARTADGREISFNVELEMSRSFMAVNESYVQSIEILRDPLVINLGSEVASLSDQKFYFDIDADGKMDEISYLEGNSGFLALDKNNDGEINDGSELFGTKSGDGFKDLAMYDEDGNGWIDEADSVFDNLKIWTKNSDGTDSLIAIGKAGVGAIYLGSATTQFSINSLDDNSTNGVIQKTGVFLKENGSVGTIQHIDLAI
ncbi:MAG: hypothetical protein UEA60_09630 [Lachnospiraceae bacterium]|nr:hypothetical protein [Lachnospiraceae bacterium]MEE0686899.1 hypothetical protein [Lachnospiraceae bacterium]